MKIETITIHVKKPHVKELLGKGLGFVDKTNNTIKKCEKKIYIADKPYTATVYEVPDEGAGWDRHYSDKYDNTEIILKPGHKEKKIGENRKDIKYFLNVREENIDAYDGFDDFYKFLGLD